MSDLSAYYKRLSALLESGAMLWQASVVETDGSTPARIGMKLAIPLSEDTFGNLGGGELEYLVINTIRQKQPKSLEKWNFNLDEQGLPHPAENSEGPSGSGNPAREKNTDKIVQKSTRKVVRAASEIRTSMLCGGSVEVLVEPLFSPHPLYIIGAGHCGRALADFAVKAEFQVTVIDNRKDLLQKDAFPPECKLIHNDYTCLDNAISFNGNAFIVIMTYGHAHDRQVLEYCLTRPFRYLGMIGSQKKVAQTLVRVKANGFSDNDLSKVRAPIGLPIGSHTPYEIAVSILAQLIQIKNLP